MTALDCPPELVDGAVHMVTQLIAAYRDAGQPYRVHIRPKPSRFANPYDHLARLREWQADGGPEGGHE